MAAVLARRRVARVPPVQKTSSNRKPPECTLPWNSPTAATSRLSNMEPLRHTGCPGRVGIECLGPNAPTPPCSPAAAAVESGALRRFRIRMLAELEVEAMIVSMMSFPITILATSRRRPGRLHRNDPEPSSRGRAHRRADDKAPHAAARPAASSVQPGPVATTATDVPPPSRPSTRIRKRPRGL